MRRREAVPVCAFIIFVLCLGMIPSPGFAFEEREIYGFAESFTWREFGDGEQLLRESGPLFGVGVTFRFFEPHSPAVKVRGEIFGGQVDYVGQTQAGVPATSDTNYFGIKTEGDLGVNFKLSQRFSLEPFAGLGFKWWIRDIENGFTSSGTPVQGVEEFWNTIYFRLGLRGDYNFSQVTRAFAEAGIRLPVYTENEPEDLGITLEPGNQPSLFAEAGMKFNKVKVSGYYEGLRFKKSDAVSVWYQPESKADIYGIRVGYIF